MLRIELMPAERGDCLWVTWGDRGGPQHVMLIDGGPSQSIETLVPELERRLVALGPGDDRVELLVQTHIDADHIQGLVSLLSQPMRVKLFRDVWFNGLRHVSDILGVGDAEVLTSALTQYPERWNAAFGGAAVVVPDAPAPLPVVDLAGGMRLTLLAPTPAALAALAPEWQKWVDQARRVPTVPKRWRRDDVLGGFDPDAWAHVPDSEDRSKPNSAGIAFVAEHGRRRVAFLADVPPRFVLAAFRRAPEHWRGKDGRIRLDAVKVSHHGSRGNTSRRLCDAVACSRWLFSTDGTRFGHPHPETLGRIVAASEAAGDPPPTFVFNHVTPFVADVVAGAGARYRVEVPRQRGGVPGAGISVTWR